MDVLDSAHALCLAMLAAVVGILSVLALRAARGMVEFPERYRRALLDKEATHPLAFLWSRRGGERSIRRWGTAFSRVALFYAVFSFVTAGVLVALMIMDRAGMDNAVEPIAEFLSKFEADLVG